MIGAHITEHIGIAIRLTFIGLGSGAFSHTLTQTTDGWRYWAGAGTGIGLYLLGAILEFAGEHSRKKEEK